ncbi:hypothetical protein GBA65_15030 [Rubrobacter marinus]|uniref:Uncharacterized protein n=1 Tax=Rubrobacter marinus TaxID=2653852 RepID=A0A6G8PZM0_9ACTN|nr:hypothetical protein [Rubrobacter marinus]QIN79618.1 hypothetical protein GBA65_15030 [Rubrobacter marinus]
MSVPNVRRWERFWERDARLAEIRERLREYPEDDVEFVDGRVVGFVVEGFREDVVYLFGQYEGLVAEQGAMLEALNAVHAALQDEDLGVYLGGRFPGLYAAVVGGQHASARAEELLRELSTLDAWKGAIEIAQTSGDATPEERIAFAMERWREAEEKAERYLVKAARYRMWHRMAQILLEIRDRIDAAFPRNDEGSKG